MDHSRGPESLRHIHHDRLADLADAWHLRRPRMARHGLPDTDRAPHSVGGCKSCCGRAMGRQQLRLANSICGGCAMLGCMQAIVHFRLIGTRVEVLELEVVAVLHTPPMTRRTPTSAASVGRTPPTGLWPDSQAPYMKNTLELSARNRSVAVRVRPMGARGHRARAHRPPGRRGEGDGGEGAPPYGGAQ